jgi:hypothetical protein
MRWNFLFFITDTQCHIYDKTRLRELAKEKCSSLLWQWETFYNIVGRKLLFFITDTPSHIYDYQARLRELAKEKCSSLLQQLEKF